MVVGDAYMFPGFLTPLLTQLSFKSHRLLFSHASAEMRGENTPERKFALTGYRTHNNQVMSPTRSPLNRAGLKKREKQLDSKSLSYTLYHRKKKKVCSSNSIGITDYESNAT